MMKFAMPVSPYPTFPRYPLLNPLPQAGEEANEKGTFQSLREKGQTKKAIFTLTMRIVLDTNTLISGVISPSGSPRQLLNAARTQRFELCSSAVLMAELLDVLSREKFAARLVQAGLTPLNIVSELRRLAYISAPENVPRVIAADPDDDHVLACAVAAQADLIVSGDRHLHSLGGNYQGIRIVSAAEAAGMIARP